MTDEEPSRGELKRRVERLEALVAKLTPQDVGRRRALQALAAGATGATLGGAGFLAGQERAAATPSTSDSDANIGDPSNPVDVFADGIELQSEIQNNASETILAPQTDASIKLPNGGPNDTGQVAFANGRIFENASGEIVVEDSAGNQTTIS